MLEFRKQQKDQGFSLIELMIVVAVMITLAAITVPRVLNITADVNLRYTATNIGGLLQSARMQAVRQNTYVHIQGGAYTVGDPLLPLNSQITAFQGTGSGAPNEATFTTGLSFTLNPGSDNPSFNARGLPCFASSGSCPQTPGQGFVIFLSNSSVTGNIFWSSVVITPSGRVQIWTCDGSGSWVQRN
jgi:prepilin-type N-terminal cleavage/methylation domain-containing protein